MDPDRQEFVDWARGAAVPLATTEPGTGVADLRPLLALVGSARVIGLGEATHGTREFFQLKHRLLEQLVDEAGFDQFHIEASVPEALDIDDYVRTGLGDAEALLAGMRFWVWNTEEVLALIEDLRDRRGAVRFLGVDLQFAPVAVRRLLAIAGRPAQALVADLRPLLDEGLADMWRWVAEPDRDTAGAAFAELVAVAEQAASGEEERVTVQRLAATIDGWRDMARQPDIWDVRAVRDQRMAEHTLGWLGAGRAVVWAHNQHVGRNGFSGRFASMGGHLADKMGGDYVPVGFAFARGGFQAVGSDDRLSDHHVDSPPPGSFEEALAEVGQPLFALDLTAAPQGAARWLAGKPPTRSIGSGFTGEGGTLDLDPREQYDVVIYVEETTAARRMPTAVRVPAEPVTTASEWRNLDFTSATDDGRPTDWVLPEIRVLARYSARCVEVDGAPAVLVARQSSRWRFGKAVLQQRVDATPLRGRRVRVTGELRRDGHPLDGSARLVLDAAGDSDRAVGVGEPAGSSGDWTPTSLELVVPDDATTLTLAFVVTGNDAALARNITVAAV
jgi:erythromycin esterase